MFVRLKAMRKVREIGPTPRADTSRRPENFREPPGGAGGGPRHPLPPAARYGRGHPAAAAPSVGLVTLM
jgi:hypothetical protein